MPMHMYTYVHVCVHVGRLLYHFHTGTMSRRTDGLNELAHDACCTCCVSCICMCIHVLHMYVFHMYVCVCPCTCIRTCTCVCM